ncbi:MAG TPA: hypothetical protein VIO14_11285 [Dehalococcoidia bacterium]
MSAAWPWLTLAALGAYHGVNPGMGWLFAVARGLQEGSRRAVLLALLPIALGHELAIALVAALVLGAEVVADPGPVRLAAAAAVVAFGVYKLARPRSHPRWVGMRVSLPELGLWSFLMSSAHGAGLMLVPVLLGMDSGGEGGTILGHGVETGAVLQDAAAVTVHTLAMLAAMGTLAVLVYEKLGVAVLRKAWFNLDVIWGTALIVAGVFTLFT